jgi:hypothetical protein
LAISGEKRIDPIEEQASRRNTILRELAANISSYHILKLRLSGYVYVGDHKLPGWSGELPFYAFECKKHGVVVNYPTGYEERLECPFCLEEENT